MTDATPTFLTSVSPLEVLRRVNVWIVLLCAAICAIGIGFIRSATLGDELFGAQPARQLLFLCIGATVGLGLLFVPYARIMRYAWAGYVLAVLALLALPFFGSLINGARRWFYVFGFGVQPSEFAKLAVIVVIASWLRFRHKATTWEGLLVPVLITAFPVGLVFMQPDLGSSLVFWPVLLAMCWAAGASTRSLLALVGCGAATLLVGYFTILHDYQRQRVEVWLSHFGWDRAEVLADPAVGDVLRGAAYQPWQSLIAIGSGGTAGFGWGQGPQSRFDFLPYRSVDYVFSVVVEELGVLGAFGLLALQLVLVVSLLGVALRTRERFGRLVLVGIATYLGTQSLLHVAVCSWLVPATGLPMPFVSYGGSSTIVAVVSVALALNIGARREPVLASDGFS